MRKYRLWPRRDQVGMNGYSLLYPLKSVTRPVAVRRSPAGATFRRRPRRNTLARQRRALVVLLGALVVPALVGLATGAAAAWWVVVALLPVLCAYLAVLFRTRRLMAEREINVAFFGSSGRTLTGLEDVFSARDDHPGQTFENVGAASAGSFR